MSNNRKRAMEAMLEAAESDIRETLEENDITDAHSEEADDTVLDVAILYAYRVFIRVCESQGLTADVHLFAELATDLGLSEPAARKRVGRIDHRLAPGQEAAGVRSGQRQKALIRGLVAAK